MNNIKLLCDTLLISSVPVNTARKSTLNSLDIKSSAGDSARRASDEQGTTVIADKTPSVRRQQREQRAVLLVNITQQDPTIIQCMVQTGHQPTRQLMCQ